MDALFPPDVVGVYFGIAIMLGTSLVLRRSLGAMPVWLSVILATMALDAMLVLRDGTAVDRALPLLANVMPLPTIFMLLARSQAIPGLRRGSVEGAHKRQANLLNQALAGRPDLQRAAPPARPRRSAAGMRN
ncbi:hypothetical protein [Sphingomonas nostoxanthinifaciens]|uniref:hypothetical protein n=1 Tax=Sphingomonas nostoxanthinifaciens TaxID=2872652 RepID=UPI001CC1E0CB|nr:hypothetical protein [Sphingomonas nostoxanthinifaciens]UAK23269.1 hypothetical protein K8P63_12725 [Sphingomonas nostoxanthinifaciens]